jgi:hypothetical protein
MERNNPSLVWNDRDLVQTGMGRTCDRAKHPDTVVVEAQLRGRAHDYYYRHVTLITGLCFQFWFLHPILKSLWENQTPDQNVSPLSSCRAYRYISLVSNAQYVSTHKVIYGRQNLKFRAIMFPFCTAGVMLWRCFMHSPHIHRSCLALLDVTSMTWRQVGATGEFGSLFGCL